MKFSRTRPERTSSSGPRRKFLSLLATGGLVVGLAGFPAPQHTEALWTDSEHTTAQLTAVQLTPPIITNTVCTKVVIGLLMNSFTVTWKTPGISGIPSENLSVYWSSSNGELPNQPPIYGPDSNGEYTSNFTEGLLPALVTLLIGGSVEMHVQTTLNSGNSTWLSQGSSTVHLNVPPLLGAPTCSYTNG